MSTPSTDAPPSASNQQADPEPLLEVTDLHVDFPLSGGTLTAVDGVSFALRPGQCLALVGESGSGKSVTARALLGLAGDGATVSATRLHARGRDLRAVDPRDWREIRGGEIGLVLQDALGALNPLRRIGAQVAEPLRAHRLANQRQAHTRALELLTRVALPDPQRHARQYPHQLSGGQRQRALIAAAIACQPPVLIADEPTTALDVTIQAQILELLDAIKRDGTALLLISHDLSVVARLADTIAVMRAGRILETGPTRQILDNPRHEYTRELIRSIPGTQPKQTRALTPPDPHPPQLAGDTDHEALFPVDTVVAPAPAPVLEAVDLVKRYDAGRAGHTAVDHVSFRLHAGRTLGLVGESGSGKTTTARLVLAELVPDAGEVTLDGQPWSQLPERERRHRRRSIQAIHQDPLGSFDPRYTVEQLIVEALEAGSSRARRRTQVIELLDQVGLPAAIRTRHPAQLSGGQRQRVAIARALAPGPRILVCDEPVSALDVTVQAHVLELLMTLQREKDLAILFISHDLGVIREVSDTIAVMHSGRIIEAGSAEAVYRDPGHPYTRELLHAAPRLDAAAAESVTREETP